MPVVQESLTDTKRISRMINLLLMTLTIVVHNLLNKL